MDVSEEELLAAIQKVLSGSGPEVVVGVGDDAAVLIPGTGQLVITTDAMVEGSHFARSTTSARDLGYKAIVVNVSDIAAMGASPRYAVCALTLSDEVDAAWAMEMLGGMREAADEYALWLVGGNLASGRDVTVTVTVTGEVASGRAVLRSGAHLGDRILVTGSLGGSAAGLRVGNSKKRWSDEERDAIARHFRPVARVGEGQALARHGATAMIDISDGFALDLSRVCAASEVGARVSGFEAVRHPAATAEEALSGGEDYELLAAMPADGVEAATAELRESFGVALTDVGEFVDRPGMTMVAPDGTERSLEPRGWDHFAD
ncbi:MAG: thiamine-phosphate kinase [Actinomycetota bacterium]|nr:thiamine-phosphate kinase [Actinomycetota bacterium]